MMYRARSSFGTSYLLRRHRQIRARIVGEHRGESLDRGLLFLVELRGHRDVERHVEVAGVPAGRGDAAALHLLRGAGLGAGLHLERDGIGERRHAHLGAERGLGERDRDVHREVTRALAAEHRVRAHLDHDVEIAGRTAVAAGRAALGHLDALPVLDPDRQLHLHVAPADLRAAAVTARARVRDHHTPAVTHRADLRGREEPLVHRDLARAAALGAHLRRGAGTGAAAVALGALGLRGERHRRGDAADRVEEVDRDLGLEVGTALGRVPSRASTAATEPACPATAAAPAVEQPAEQVAEVHGVVELEAAAAAARVEAETTARTAGPAGV